MYQFFTQHQKRKTVPFLKRGNAGFTLVELMVSLSLFTVVILATISSLLIVNDASKKVQSMRTVMDNLNFALESMSRTIRTGSEIGCGGVGSGPDCPYTTQVPSSTLGLTLAPSSIVEKVEYRREVLSTGGVIQKREYNGSTWTPWYSMTAPEINIQSLQFYVEGANAADTMQPSVTMFIKGVATAANQTAPFSIQTIVSQRTIE